MEKIKEIEINYKMYTEFVSMLNGSDEDFEIACSNIQNIKLSDIMITLLTKNLKFFKRSQFLDRFSEHVSRVLNTQEPLNLRWEDLYESITADSNATKLEKNIMEKEIEAMVSETLKNLEYTFIKKIKIELK
jgi:hypothetical protein